MKRMSRSLRNAGAIFLSIAISSAAPAATSMQAASLLAVDQNRPEIIDGLVARWKGYLAAGKEVELKRTLTTLRADKLLALALAQDEKSFAALLEKDSFLPVNGAQRVTQAKELGDASRDVVYRPIDPSTHAGYSIPARRIHSSLALRAASTPKEHLQHKAAMRQVAALLPEQPLW